MTSARLTRVIEQVQSTHPIKAKFDVVLDLEMSSSLFNKDHYGCLYLWIIQDLGNIHVDERLQRYNNVFAVLRDLEGRYKILFGLNEAVVFGE